MFLQALMEEPQARVRLGLTLFAVAFGCFVWRQVGDTPDGRVFTVCWIVAAPFAISLRLPSTAALFATIGLATGGLLSDRPWGALAVTITIPLVIAWSGALAEEVLRRWLSRGRARPALAPVAGTADSHGVH